MQTKSRGFDVLSEVFVIACVVRIGWLRSFAFFRYAVLPCVVLLGSLVTSGSAQEERSGKVYEPIWSELSTLLWRREYANAVAKLDAFAGDIRFRDQGPLIEADKQAIASLQRFEQLVFRQAANLPPESMLKISGMEYQLVRYERGGTGDALILKSRSLGRERETRKMVSDLPAETWVELAKSEFSTLEKPQLTLGIFLAFDRTADHKAARKLLNEAATSGHEVVHWLERLDAADAKSPSTSRGADPIIGSWSGSFEPIYFGFSAAYEFRANGTGVITVDKSVLKNKKPKRMHPARWSDLKSWARMGTFDWKRDENGFYKLSFHNGLASDGVSLSDDTLAIPRTGTFTRRVKK